MAFLWEIIFDPHNQPTLPLPIVLYAEIPQILETSNHSANHTPNRKRVEIAPSLLSANFADLAASVRQAEAGGAGWLHIDVMDGHFVPNITVGPVIVEALRPLTKLTFDVHLMIEDPDAYIPQFVNAGADVVTVHQEACRHLNRTVSHIKSLGVKAGVAINPATPLAMLEEILPDLDMVLLMSVNPGFGGQSFIPSLYRRARTLRKWIDREGYDCLIEADGGIKLENAAEVYKAGVDVLVSGSGIFGEPYPEEAIRKIKRACEETQLIEV